MEFVPLTPDLRAAWDEFCLKSPDAWFLHTTRWLDYNLAYRPELKPRSYSFLCRENGKFVAVVPLIVSSHEQDGRRWKSFSFLGNGIPSPALDGALTAAERDDAMDAIFSAIDGLAAELGVAHSRFRIEGLRPAMREPRSAPANALLRHGMIDCSTNTQMIDLRLSRNDLWNGMRRNHQRSVDKARTLFKIRHYSGAELGDDKFDEYVSMHARAAGRTTRPRATFDIMRDVIRSGDGLMTEAVDNEGRTAGFELYAIYKDGAVGLSACNEPEYKHLPIRHLIEWESILWMRRRDVKFYEVGRQQFGTLPYDFPEKKNLDISHFKYGFGGAMIPCFEAERFYSREFWRAENAARLAKFEARYEFDAAPRDGSGRDLLKRFEKAAAADADAAAGARPEAPPTEADYRTADEVIRANPDGVRKWAQGNEKAFHFLVGLALKAADKGRDPRPLRRALEERLAKAVAATKQT